MSQELENTKDLPVPAREGQEAPRAGEVVDSLDPAIAELELQAAADASQAAAEQAEETSRPTLQMSLPAAVATHAAQELSMSPAVQALWSAVLPLVGVMPSRPGEFPGVFKVEPGDNENEARVLLDVPAEPYSPGHKSDMDRVLSLSVNLDHDYRRFGNGYFCADCEDATETRH